jgi:hypothetical protein
MAPLTPSYLLPVSQGVESGRVAGSANGLPAPTELPMTEPAYCPAKGFSTEKPQKE